MLTYQGLTWMDTSTIGVQITNFPWEKGLASGLIITQCGLASSAIVLLSIGFFPTSTGGLSNVPVCAGEKYVGNQPQPSLLEDNSMSEGASGGLWLLFFLSLLCLFLGVGSSYFLRIIRGADGKKGLEELSEEEIPRPLSTAHIKRILRAYYMVLFIMLYLAIVSGLNVYWSAQGVQEFSRDRVFASVLAILYLFPLFLGAVGSISLNGSSGHGDKGQSVYLQEQHEEDERKIFLEQSFSQTSSFLGMHSTSSINFKTSPSLLFSNPTGSYIRMDSSSNSGTDPGLTTGLQLGGDRDNSLEQDLHSAPQGQPSLHSFTFSEALQSLDFWCLCFIFFGGTGAANMTINQLAQINAGKDGACRSLLTPVWAGCPTVFSFVYHSTLVCKPSTFLARFPSSDFDISFSHLSSFLKHCQS